MMSCDKYKRVYQYLYSGHQRTTLKKSGPLLQSSSYCPSYETWSAKFISGNLKGNIPWILRFSSLLYTFVSSNTTQILLPVTILSYF